MTKMYKSKINHLGVLNLNQQKKPHKNHNNDYIFHLQNSFAVHQGTVLFHPEFVHKRFLTDRTYELRWNAAFVLQMASQVCDFRVRVLALFAREPPVRAPQTILVHPYKNEKLLESFGRIFLKMLQIKHKNLSKVLLSH